MAARNSITASFAIRYAPQDGADGADGKGISSITEYYARSTSNTTAPTTWSTTCPTLTATYKYLWNYEEITYTDGTTTATTPHVVGVYGNTGADGETPYTVDLDNEFSGIACDSSGDPTGSYETTHLYIYHGTENVTQEHYDGDSTDGYDMVIMATGITCSCTFDTDTNAYLLTVSDITQDRATVVADVYWAGTMIGSRTYTIVKVYAGQDGADGADGQDATVYSLLTDTNVIKVDADGNLTTTTINVSVKKTSGSETTIIDNIIDLVNDENAVIVINEASFLDDLAIDVASYLTDGKIKLVLGAITSGTIYDQETIYAVQDGEKGEQGEAGSDGSSGTTFYAIPDSIVINVSQSQEYNSTTGEYTESVSLSDNSGTIEVYDSQGSGDKYALVSTTPTEDGDAFISIEEENNCSLTTWNPTTGVFAIKPTTSTTYTDCNGATWTMYTSAGSVVLYIEVYTNSKLYSFRHTIEWQVEQTGTAGCFTTSITGLTASYTSLSSNVGTLEEDYSTLMTTASNFRLTVAKLTEIYDEDGNAYGLVESLQNTMQKSGIDIYANKIVMSTNNFYVTDSTGENTTLTIDSDGNLVSTQYENSTETGSISFGQDGIEIYGGNKTKGGYNGLIKIGVVGGIPYMLGIDSEGKTKWSFGAANTVTGNLSVKFLSGIYQTASSSFIGSIGSGYGLAYYLATFYVVNNTLEEQTLTESTGVLLCIVDNPWQTDTYLGLPLKNTLTLAAGEAGAISFEATFIADTSNTMTANDYITAYAAVEGELRTQCSIACSAVEDDTTASTWNGATTTSDCLDPTSSNYLIEEYPW